VCQTYKCAFKETDEETSGKYWRHRHAEGETESHGRPEHHRDGEDLGDGEAANKLSGDGFTDNETYPHVGTGERVVLALGASVLEPAHD
jgi:hypothetical protein